MVEREVGRFEVVGGWSERAARWRIARLLVNMARI